MFEWIKAQAIALGLRRKAPSRFSYSKSNNFYSQSLENEESKEKVLVQSMDKWKIDGLEWMEAANRFERPKEINRKDLNNWRLRTYRFYGGARYDYDGTWDFWKNELTFRPWRNFILGHISQSFFNALYRFRSDRMEALRRIVELNIEAAKNDNGLLYKPTGKSIVQLQSEFFGLKIYGHPAYEEISARFRLIIDSLAESGDLERVELHNYRLSGKALATLADFELDERRHKDAVRQNKRLFLITVVIAVATAIQAYSAFLSP